MVRGQWVHRDDSACKENIPIKKIKPSSSAESQLGLAHHAIENKWFTLATDGCWIVKDNDGTTPYGLTLFPKETCSCLSQKGCYHIMA